MSFFKGPTISLVGPTKLLIMFSHIFYVIFDENISKISSYYLNMVTTLYIKQKEPLIAKNRHPIAQNHHSQLLFCSFNAPLSPLLFLISPE